MIDREHDLPITKQAKVLRISRGSVLSLSQMSSGWRGTTNRVMLSPDVGRLEIAVVTSDRVLPIARVT